MLVSRLARNQGLYGMTSRCHCWALYLIAENLNHDTTVLENPYWDGFVAELKKGYDVVGIQLKSMHVPECARMMKAVRDYAPNTQIVIGGYGVLGLDEVVPGDTEKLGAYIRDNADHLCLGEGVRFMRELLGDTPVDRPIEQDHVPLIAAKQELPFRSTAVRPVVASALGCPAGCDFCCTSAAFKKQKIFLADPARLYATMKMHQQRLGRKLGVIQIYNEDMFLETEYVRELGRLIRSDRRTWPIRWQAFGSVKALSRFEPRELFECGLAGVWIGIESLFTEGGRPKCGYAKRSAPKTEREVISGLRRFGVNVTASMILGLDFHTPENIIRDIEAFVSLKPTFSQFAPLMPCPGTALHKKLMAENRLRSEYSWGHGHLWHDDVVKRKHFKKGELIEWYDWAYEKLRTELGPPVVQLYETLCAGYETLRGSTDGYSRYHAGRFRRGINRLHPVLEAIRRHPPSTMVRDRVEGLQKNAERLCGRRSRWKLPYDLALRGLAHWRISRAKALPEPADGEEQVVELPTYRVHYAGNGKRPVVEKQRRGDTRFPSTFHGTWRSSLSDLARSMALNAMQDKTEAWESVRTRKGKGTGRDEHVRTLRVRRLTGRTG
jgi:radical SAM superfamily enzyme YgiQ (UPF0313 family)